jgi:hypothetical protein
MYQEKSGNPGPLIYVMLNAADAGHFGLWNSENFSEMWPHFAIWGKYAKLNIVFNSFFYYFVKFSIHNVMI